jgi:hypothetical protein
MIKISGRSQRPFRCFPAALARGLSCAALILTLAMLFPMANAITAGSVSTDQPLLWLKAGLYEKVEAYYAGAQRNYQNGQISDEQLYSEFRKLYEDEPGNSRYFDQWVTTYPKSYSARLARGAYLYRMAWAVRGEEFINKTPVEKIQQMERYLDLATPDLRASLTMTAKPYLSALYLLNVSILGGPADERRQWLDLGTEFDPKNVLLRKRYMFSLQPKWGGSMDEMQEFVDECVRAHVAPDTITALKLTMATAATESMTEATSAAERFARWGEVLQLSKTLGTTAEPKQLAAYARAAWDLHRREDTDRALAQLAAIDVSDAWALEQMGWIYAKEGRMAEAWPVLQKSASKNDAYSQFTVGKTLIQGCPEIKLAPDRAGGMVWIHRAADQGFAEAVAFLKQ